VWRPVGYGCRANRSGGSGGSGGIEGMEMEMEMGVVGGELDKKKSGGRRLTKVARDEPKSP